ncbi:MAG: hypothetical protein NT040_08680 [Bacteroidetes bacterium]|nr:hypothetical protein [Bacteroidota bacterium]
MESRLISQITLLLLVLGIAGFDRHLSGYFPGEVTAMVQSDAAHSHGDVPVKSCDSHEDIALKTFSSLVPVPPEHAFQNYQDFNCSIFRISPHTVWQPPETKA